MKKLIVLWLILICVATTAEAKLYYRFGNIIDLEWDTDIVSADDGMGNIWEFDGCDYFFVDDLILMIMEDNDTPDYIYDDKVINAYGILAEDAEALINYIRECNCTSIFR